MIINNKKFDKDNPLVLKMIQEGYLNVSPHPTAPLLLWNYSKTAQIYHIWNEVTEVCRGLVTDLEGNIVSRPFKKFWNYEEIQDKSSIPDSSGVQEITDKLDGSLGIMYWVSEVPYITTRGKFESPQGLHATEVLQRKYLNTPEIISKIPKNLTFLFEIIWPEGDPHCIRYPGVDDIFLIGVIDTETGLDYGSIKDWEWLFKCTKIYDNLTDYTKARDLIPGDNREGFVVRFKDSSRIKLKYPGYLRLHYLKSYLTPKVIFGYVSEGRESELIESLRDLDFEQLQVAIDIIKGYHKRYHEIEKECLDFIQSLGSFKDIREVVDKIKPYPYSGIIFRSLRGQNCEDTIWKYIFKEIP